MVGERDTDKNVGILRKMENYRHEVRYEYYIDNIYTYPLCT